MTRLKKIELFTYDHKFSSIGKKKSLILKFSDKDSHYSYSEVSPLSNRSYESFDEAQEVVFTLCKNLMSNQAHQFKLPSSVMFAMTAGLSQLKQKHGIIKFKARDLLITNSTKPDLTNFSNLIKVKIANLSIKDAIDLCKYLVGQGKKICVDCNAVFSLNDMLFFSKHFEKKEIEYIEEPVSSFSDLIAFSQQSDLAIALDESLYLHPIERLKTLKNLKLFILKPTLIGGKDEHKAIIDKCFPIPCTLSSSYESSIGMTNIIALAHELNITEALGINTCRYASNSIVKNANTICKNYLDFSKIEIQEEMLCPLILR